MNETSATDKVEIPVTKENTDSTPLPVEVPVTEADSTDIQSKDKKLKGRRLFYKPNKGNAWNPLLKYPPNMKCFCTSGKKDKKCCLPFLPAAVTEEEAKNMKLFMDGVFKMRGKK